MSITYTKYTTLGSEHYENKEYMPGAIKWDQTNEHYYETGVKQAVIYLKERTPAAGTTEVSWKPGASGTAISDVKINASRQYYGGVAWNGLISCTQNPDGADTEDLYANNDKYLSLRAKEDFAGSLSAYTYPDLWAICDGTALVGTTGVIRVHGQTRKTFGLSYITQEGNDTSFQDFGEKLHIIYEATASPTDREYSTINDSPEAIEMSWDFKTTPIDMTALGANLTKSSYIEILKKECPTGGWDKLLLALHGWGDGHEQTSVLCTDYCPAFLPLPGEIATILGVTVA